MFALLILSACDSVVGFDAAKHVSRVASQQREEGAVKIPALVLTVRCQAVSAKWGRTLRFF